MKILATMITALLLAQTTVRDEEPWRFINLADWHGAEVYVQPDLFPGMAEQLLVGLKMLN